MSSIIVVFPKKEIATNIRNILVRNGFDVIGVGVTGAQAVQLADNLDDGIVVCGYKMTDMLYNELRDYLPSTIEMLLIASPEKCSDRTPGVISLSMPFKVFDLMNTIEMMAQSIGRRRKKRRAELKNRNPEQQALVKEAKSLLMERNNMTGIILAVTDILHGHVIICNNKVCLSGKNTIQTYLLDSYNRTIIDIRDHRASISWYRTIAILKSGNVQVVIGNISLIVG